jgi:lipid-binding SYLF domain-containing protein
MMRNSVSNLALFASVALLLVTAIACQKSQPVPAPEAPAPVAEQRAEPVVEEPAAEQPAPEAGAEEPEWKTMKQEAKAQKIDETADETLQELFAENAKAKTLYENSYGWAVFDNLKMALGISGGGGNGVAVEKASGERTYMKMGTGGVGLGIGVNKYQVVFLFEDAQTFTNFVEKGWQAEAEATAAAGESAAEAKTNFVNGLAIYQLTEKGLMANADIAGTKYWKNKKLND